MFRSLAPLALLSLVPLIVVACPGAQVKEGGGPSGDVEMVLRRIDVVDADFDQLKVNVIIAVRNDTGSDIDVESELDIALFGPSVDDGSGSGGGAEGGVEEGAAEATIERVDAPEPGGLAAGLDGSRHKGTGRGKASAYNTSELPVTITLPLPSDPAVLEQVLSWRKARVHVKGTAKAGLFTTQTLAGERDVATPILPEFKVKTAQIAKLDDGVTGEAFIKMGLDNKNPFEATVDRVVWSIQIAGKELRTKEDGNTTLPPSAVEEYDETVEINERAFPLKELKAILKAPSVPYVVSGSFEVRGIKKDFEFKGDMQFPR